MINIRLGKPEVSSVERIHGNLVEHAPIHKIIDLLPLHRVYINI